MLKDFALEVRHGTLRNNNEKWWIMESRVRDTPLVTFKQLGIQSNQSYQITCCVAHSSQCSLFVGIFFNGGYFSLIIRFITGIHKLLLCIMEPFQVPLSPIPVDALHILFLQYSAGHNYSAEDSNLKDYFKTYIPTPFRAEILMCA